MQRLNVCKKPLTVHRHSEHKFMHMGDKQNINVYTYKRKKDPK